MHKISVAIIGCGQFGTKRAIAVQQHPDFELVGVFDCVPTAAAKLAAATQCKVFSDLATLLADKSIDAVCVCTPNHLHADQSSQAIAAHKHVLCEKPAGIQIDDFKQLQTALHKNSQFSWRYGHTHRFFTTIMQLQKWLADKKIGTINKLALTIQSGRNQHSTDWFTQPATAGGGTLIDNGHHLFDLVFLFLNSVDNWRVLNTKLDSHSTITCESEAHLQLVRAKQLIEINSYWRAQQPYIEIIVTGNKGTATATEQSATLTIGDKTTTFVADDQPGSAISKDLTEWAALTCSNDFVGIKTKTTKFTQRANFLITYGGAMCFSCILDH